MTAIGIVIDVVELLTEECTSREDGGDEGLLGRSDHVASWVVCQVGCRATEEAQPVLHGGDTRDGTGIVTEQDTSEGGEADHEDASKLVLWGIGTEARTRRSGTTCHDVRLEFC